MMGDYFKVSPETVEALWTGKLHRDEHVRALPCDPSKGVVWQLRYNAFRTDSTGFHLMMDDRIVASVPSAGPFYPTKVDLIPVPGAIDCWVRVEIRT